MVYKLYLKKVIFKKFLSMMPVQVFLIYPLGTTPVYFFFNSG